MSHTEHEPATSPSKAPEATPAAGTEAEVVPTAGAEAVKKESGALLGWLKETAIILAAILLIMTVMRHLLFQLYIIPSGSMENTLKIDDRIIVPQFLPYHRGDVVVFADPGGWLGSAPAKPNAGEAALQFVGLLPDTSQNYLVKRVIGMPGDDVKCCTVDGRLTVNGTALDESSYLYTDSSGHQVAPSDFPFEVVVPADKVFVMGDHRNNSDDSRCHLIVLGDGAFVPRNKIKGVAAATLFPFGHWRSFKTPATFANVPAAASVPQQATIHAEQVTCR